jgi:hypothetical protein
MTRRLLDVVYQGHLHPDAAKWYNPDLLIAQHCKGYRAVVSTTSLTGLDSAGTSITFSILIGEPSYSILVCCEQTRIGLYQDPNTGERVDAFAFLVYVDMRMSASNVSKWAVGRRGTL